jgi:S-adenosylmethionine hydrolase
VIPRGLAAAIALALAVAAAPASTSAQGTLLLQSDFGTRDGAVASMKGVATGVDATLRIHDLTHQIEPFDIWEGAYRLRQVTPFWPAGTVVVSIVDPGVGTARLGVVARTRRGLLIVTPDNGTLTLIADEVVEVREIDLARQRLPGSERSHTFHGRDVFAYLGARLAAGQVRFEDVGPSRGTEMVRLPVPVARRDGTRLHGMIAMIDRPYGNLWTNIPAALVDSMGWRQGDTLTVVIDFEGRGKVRSEQVLFAASFGAVPVGRPVAYLNSLLELAVAINQGSYAERHEVGAGPAWTITIVRTGAAQRDRRGPPPD